MGEPPPIASLAPRFLYVDEREKTQGKKGIGREGCRESVKEGVNGWGVLKYISGGNEMSSRRGHCS